ncbi:MAG TPA: tetratricopeptide repeat protein [Gemmatimonadaceae bacterium]|nr:tetratricopeptide repeat protein [Gemmatimonadaceae bacterium]
MRRILLLLVAAFVPALAAQKPPKPVERPELDARADTNDALAYWKYGWNDRVSWKKSLDAFYWAHRLQPDDTYIIVAFHQAFWMRQTPQWRNEYLNGAGYVVKSKEAKFLDSLRYELAIRNPMVFLSGTCYRIRGIEHERDHVLSAVLLYDGRCYKEAAVRYAQAIEKFPGRLWLRIDRAHALYRSSQHGEAIAELQAVLDTLEGRAVKRLAHQYETRAIFEFMIGNIYLDARNREGAREAYQRALTEDLSLYWVHARLAELAFDERDIRTALAEYEQAIALKEDDVVLRHDYGVALSTSGRFAEAEPHFRRALEIEPYFSTAYYNLAVSLDGQEKRAEAREAYEAFLARAPRRQSKMIITAKSRIKSLAGALTAEATPQVP